MTYCRLYLESITYLPLDRILIDNIIIIYYTSRFTRKYYLYWVPVVGVEEWGGGWYHYDSL